MPADTILHSAKIATNSVPSFVDALAITDGRITATGNARDIFRLRGPATKVIDANRCTVIPGLNDSHMHLYFRAQKLISSAVVEGLNNKAKVTKREDSTASGRPAYSNWLSI